MWNGGTVSVILPTYNEKDSIRKVCEAFCSDPYVDEVIVVNNNAAPGTSEEVARTCAREVFEPVQGYGAAIRRGFREASGDLIIVCEPDGTFSARDVIKLLAYSEDFEYVLGTRTTKEFIWQGANMGWFLKWGNWAVAKMVEFLFNTSILTDVGCTMRLISRKALERIRGGFTVNGSHFGPEMTLLCILHGISMTEISVHYRRRVGRSSVTGDFLTTLAVGFNMIFLILMYRLKSLCGRFPP